MLDNQIRTRYGSLSTPERSPAPANKPANTNVPAPQSTPQNTTPGFTTHVIAPDILLSAQESRAPRQTRIDDAVQANAAYARQTKAKQQGDPQGSPQGSADFVSSEPVAEIIPLYGQGAKNTPAAGVVQNADEPETARASNREASRAYVTAGAADGQGFGQATTNSTELYGNGLNILI